jgi:hypothetical protein
VGPPCLLRTGAGLHPHVRGRILMEPACPGVGGDKPVAARSLITGEHCGERRLVRVRIDGIAVP